MVDAIKFDNYDSYVTLIVILFGIGFGLALSAGIVALFYRRVYFRIFGCCNRKGNPEIIV